MNLIAVIILVFIFSDFILNLVADSLNLREIKEDLPDEFKDVYDARTYKRSQEYLRANTRFGWIASTVNLCLILAFWFGKGFPLLDQWVRSLVQGPVVTGMLYIGILSLIKGVISLPFSIYATFVIEERFGFNQTTWQTFVLDLLKGVLLATIIGTPLLAGILAFFEFTGANAWWYCWIVVTLYMLGVQFIAPTWIMPLFNKFKPLEEGELRDAILNYARSIRYPLENVYMMDGSRRSSKSNAFFTGFGKNKRVVLFDTLVKQHSVKELLAVLAHEMGHYKKKHVLMSIILGILQMGVMLYLFSFFISYEPLFEAFYMQQVSVYAGLIFFAMLYSPLDLLIGIIVQIMSRRNETAADRFAVETTEDGQSMVHALN
jgi:STE24 endopeptidase